MSYPTDRVQLFDRNMGPLKELSPSEVLSLVRTEELNGEHSLVITTPRRLEEGWRALTVDGTGKWREWVVTEIDEAHENGLSAVGTYHLVWSLQYDLTYSYYHDYAEVGMDSALGPGTSQQACDFALLGQTRWTRGTCDAPSVDPGDGCFAVYEPCWGRLSKVVGAFSCEIDANITVSNLYNVTARQLDIRAHLGSSEAKRRFDWGRDVTSIRRTPDPGPYYCRTVPLGKNTGPQEYAGDDETSFEWPIDITEEEPNGHYYLEDAQAAAVFRMSDGNGGWIYPTTVVYYDEDDPELLYYAALDDLENHTRPSVTYEADVVQFGRAGMDIYGVALGDDVQIVDHGFNPDEPLRLQGRVIKLEVDELSPETGTVLTIGSLRKNMGDYFSEFAASIGNSLSDLNKANERTNEALAAMGTAAYVDSLITRLNAEINATGGYSYIVPGEGFITYDVAVADPLIGTEASYVTQVKGGSIRIANTKQTPFSGLNDWNWRTVFSAGKVTTDVLTATNITTGTIQDAAHALDPTNPAAGNYWDLDNSLLVLNDGTIKANLIQGGTLTLGGANNVNGTLQVLDENGNVIDTLNKDGASITGDLTILMKEDTVSRTTTFSSGQLTITDGSGILNGITTEQTLYGTVLTHRDRVTYPTSTFNLYFVPYIRRANANQGSDAAILSDRPLKLASYIGDLTNNCAMLWLDQSIATLTVKSYTSQAQIRLSTSSVYFSRDRGDGTLMNAMELHMNTSSLTGSRLDVYGNVYATGFINNSSDRRVKRHISFLDDDAVSFIRALKPALFERAGGLHTGFYAQDVEESDPWGTNTVTELVTGELGKKPVKQLAYTDLIAPLVSYSQHLEKRVDDLESRLEALERAMALRVEGE